MARLLLTGKAVNRGGGNIVRSALVAQLQSEGHVVHTSVPEIAVVDYLVTSNRSRNNRTMKYRWAEMHGVEIISYPQMWRILDEASRLRTTDDAHRAREVEQIERDAMARQERERREQLYQQRIYDCMEQRDMTYRAAEAWVEAETAAGNAARAQSRAEEDAEADALRRLMPEPHTIPEPGTPHNNPRMPDVADTLENNRAAEAQRMEGGVQREERLRMEKERPKVKTVRDVVEPAMAPRRRIHVRR